MRGGAQSHLMLCSDNHLYVVKFQNNPQHIRVLANELFATRLAETIGLPVPNTAIVEVGAQLIDTTPELMVQFAQGSERCRAGVHFGSRYVLENPWEGHVLDYMPAELLTQVKNVELFAGILALDKWVGNADGRQATFWRKSRERRYWVTFIDQGYCFNAGEWTFPDFPLRGVYARNEVYESVSGWNSFEPWLTRIEEMDDAVIWKLTREIPTAWYNEDSDALQRLGQELIGRKRIVRALIDEFRMSPRRPFPLWDRQRRDESLARGGSIKTGVTA